MAEEMVFCPFCGKRLAPDASFCVYCGKQIPVNQSLAGSNHNPEESKSNGNKSFMTIILAIIALLFVGFGINYVLGDSNSGVAKNVNNIRSTNKNIATTPANYQGWKTVNIGEVASLEYPPTMEVQNDKYRSITGHPRPDSNGILIQQQGLNDMTPEGRSRYARIMFKTNSDDSKISLYDKLVFTQSELDEFNKEAYNGAYQMLSKLNIKVLSWDPVQIKEG